MALTSDIHGINHSCIGIHQALHSLGILFAVNDLQVTHVETICACKAVARTSTDGKLAVGNQTIHLLGELLIQESVADKGIRCRSANSRSCSVIRGGLGIIQVKVKTALRAETLQRQLVNSILQARNGLLHIEATCCLGISYRHKGRPLASGCNTILAGIQGPKLPATLHQIHVLELICHVGTVTRVEDGGWHLLAAGISVVNSWPTVAAPCNLIQQHQTTVEVVVPVVGMIQQPVVAVIVRDNL